MKYIAVFFVLFYVYNLQEASGRLECYDCVGDNDTACANDPQEVGECRSDKAMCYSFSGYYQGMWHIRRGCYGIGPFRACEELVGHWEIVECRDCDTDRCNNDGEFWK